MSHNWFGAVQFYSAEHHHRGQAHKHVRSRRQDDRSRTNHTHTVGALPQSHPGLCGTLVGPNKDTHGAPVPLRREAVGGPRHAPRDTTKTTRPRFTAPRLGTNMVAEPVCLNRRSTKQRQSLATRTSSTVHHRSRRDQTEILYLRFCRGTASAI